MKIYEKNEQELNFHEVQDGKRLKLRILILSAMVAVLFFLLGFTAFDLQVLQNDRYVKLSDRNQLRIVSQPAKRGDIYDRNGIPLANSVPEFAVAIAMAELNSSDKEALCVNLANILQDPAITSESISEQMKNHFRSYEPIVVARYDYNEYIDVLTSIEEHSADLPGVFIFSDPKRVYPMQQVSGHLVGYVGLISENEMNLVSQYDYLINDWIGKAGLERSLERFQDDTGKEIGLRGIRGVRTVEVNSRHQAVGVRSSQNPVSGNSVKLTLDTDLQKVLETSLAANIERIQKKYPKAQGGAGVLLDVKTGEVLAIASHPQMNPNDFSGGLSQELASYYWDADLKPTFNRAVSGAYPPGSTFKPITATAIVASGKVDKDFSVLCTPSAWVEPKAKCPKAHGRVNLERAMAVSCNLFFQEASAIVGQESFYDTCYKLGLGQITGIELPNEAAGILPDPIWKAKNYSGWESQWRIYDTYYMSMGQGGNMNTPLQMGIATATIANGGVRMQPYLVNEVFDESGESVYKNSPTVAADLGLSAEQIGRVQKAMEAVASPGGGTAYSLFSTAPYTVAAKTGTAQTGLPGDNKDEDYHGWFIAYAPADDPQVAFAGMIEYGYHGSASVGYVCRDIFDAWYNKAYPAPIEGEQAEDINASQ